MIEDQKDQNPILIPRPCQGMLGIKRIRTPYRGVILLIPDPDPRRVEPDTLQKRWLTRPLDQRRRAFWSYTRSRKEFKEKGCHFWHPFKCRFNPT